MEFIDTHAHLYASEFDEDINEVIQRAISEQVKRIYLPNIDLNSIEIMYKLVKEHPALFYPMMGLHPCYITKDYKSQLQVIADTFEKQDYVAVGEIGIDLYWDKTLLKEQQYAFAQQVQWSIDKKLPIVIHARDSFQEIFDVLRDFNPIDVKGVFHCFTGELAEYKAIKTLGDFKIGIGGVVTYKKSTLPDVLQHIPLSEIVLETDAPYLTPTPFRGKRNESAYLIYIAEKLATIYNCSLTHIAKTTSANAITLFGN
jgi:TatD DNase family protein